MNYLAHVFLARRSHGATIGGLLGDFVKGSAAGEYDDEVYAGIVLHRRIDRFTDAHAVVRTSRGLISAPQRRFAGIIVDVFYDHFLARHWPRFSGTPLRVFTQQVYGMLASHRTTFPERLQQVLPRMISDDWLGSYGRIEAVDAALKGIARRLRRFERARALESAVADLEEHYARFENDFLLFFPDLVQYVDSGGWDQMSLDLTPLGRPAGSRYSGQN
jgi:acyl carrier protein phosphodiesterase